MAVLTREERDALIQLINEAGLEVAQSIDWRRDDPRLQIESIYGNGRIKTLKIEYSLPRGTRKYHYLLNNEGVLYSTGTECRPVKLNERSDDVLVAVEAALRARLTPSTEADTSD